MPGIYCIPYVPGVLSLPTSHTRADVPFSHICLLNALWYPPQGCEYSVAADVLQEDPGFFHHVSQFAVEVHYSKKWCRDEQELYSYATLLELLKEAGLELVEAMVTGCAPYDQATGLLPELASRKALRLDEGHCHNYLFARLDDEGQPAGTIVAQV